MWKKIEKAITMCIAAILVVVATVSGTLAYESLSAWDWSLQTDQTVKVGLVQEQRTYDAEGTVTGLEPFEEYPRLVPLVQSAQYDGTNFDCYGMPMAEGYVDQIIRVKNEGTADAYVRVIVAVPAALDDVNDAGNNALHWNLGNRFLPDGDFSSTNAVNTAFDDISCGYMDTVVVDGIDCNLYCFTYEKPLTAGQTTKAAAFTGFYLDKDVNVVDGHILLDGVDTGFTDDNVVIHVATQAVQAYGFERAAQAFATVEISGNPWKTEPEKHHVGSYEEMVKAGEEGWEEIILANGIEIEGEVSSASRMLISGQKTEINLNGFTVTNATDNTGTGEYVYNIYLWAKNSEVLVTGNGRVISEAPVGEISSVFYATGTSEVIIENGHYNGGNGFAVWAGGQSKIIINGGTFENAVDELIYVFENGTIEINGGVFKAAPGAKDSATHMLNENNNHNGTIVVRGGTFVNFDPSNCNDGNLVAEGYQVISEQQDNGEIWYTVVPE